MVDLGVQYILFVRSYKTLAQVYKTTKRISCPSIFGIKILDFGSRICPKNIASSTEPRDLAIGIIKNPKIEKSKILKVVFMSKSFRALILMGKQFTFRGESKGYIGHHDPGSKKLDLGCLIFMNLEIWCTIARFCGYNFEVLDPKSQNLSG